MTHQPPLDQRIIDDFFALAADNKTKDVAWLYGMIATYGLKPNDLIGFTWNTDLTVSIKTKKRPVRPFHPEWVLLFQLKEKQPCRLQGRWKSLLSSLYQSMAYQLVSLNITDLLLAHRLRKNHYASFKRKQASALVLAGVS